MRSSFGSLSTCVGSLPLFRFSRCGGFAFWVRVKKGLMNYCYSGQLICSVINKKIIRN